MENIDDTQQNNGQDKFDNLTNMIYNVAQNVNLLSKQMEAMLRMDDMLQDVQNTMQQIPNEFTQLQ